jgi:hypothetical protein
MKSKLNSFAKSTAKSKMLSPEGKKVITFLFGSKRRK